MKKIFIYCLFPLCVLSACFHQANKKIPIAILTPVTHPSLEQIERGFQETIEANCPDKYRFVTYNAQGNKILMHSEVEEIIQKNYPLTLTIGTLASQMMHEVTTHKNLPRPIVFTCVNHPTEFQIVPSESSPGGHITGVKELVDFQEELNYLLQYKPEIRNILLVYNPTEPGLVKDQQRVATLVEERNLTLTTVEIFYNNELMVKVAPHMECADAVLILKDNTVVSGLDALVKLCNRYRIPLIASDLDSPDRGAAFGYGVHEIEFGRQAATKALKILEENVFPGNIPVTPVAQFAFKINAEAAEKQGIAPSLLMGGAP
jgi:putative ABC transport system substrate-binding protein